VGLASAQVVPTDWLATFDTDISALTGHGGNCWSLTTVTWDGTVNAPGGPNSPSGSMHVTINWPDTGASWTWQEVQLNFDQAGPGIDCTKWLDVECDLMVDKTNSYPDLDGNYGHFYPVGQSWTGSGWTQFAPMTITNSTGWEHYKASIASFPYNLNRLVLDFNSQRCTNTMAYWVDNVKLTAAPLPAPTLNNLQPPTPPGLTFIPATASQWQRVMVYPNEANVGTDLGWYGHATPANPVSYAFTLKDFPTAFGYQANVFFIPNATMMYTPNDTSVDWNCTNSLIFNIGTSGTNHPATAWWVSMSAKTNFQSANPNLPLLAFNYPLTPNGTWTITFTGNSTFTLTPPNPAYTTNFTMDPNTTALVTGAAAANTALTPYFGIMNGEIANIGVPAVCGGVSISGTSTNLYDTFSAGVLNTAIWTELTDYQPDIVVTTSDLLGYLSWNSPNDQGFQALQAAGSLTGPWVDICASTNWLLINSTPALHEALLSKAALHAALNGAEQEAAYFRLVKHVASQLQVLAPGETNAPGTVTGKIGTPMPEFTGMGFALTINAVDKFGYIIPSVTDTVSLSSSAGNNVWLPVATPLVNGTLTFPAWAGPYFLATGTFTITATDTTNPAIAPGTSGPINVPQ
jgi:hypothetical protein